MPAGLIVDAVLEHEGLHHGGDSCRLVVDRGIPLFLPEGVRDWCHPELADTGPGAYDIADVKAWLHHGQKINDVSGKELYGYLRAGHLHTCLGYRDALAMLSLGYDVFERVFGGDTHLFFWRSVAHTAFGLAVPRLSLFTGSFAIDLVPLMFRWHNKAPAARFKVGVSC